MTESPESTIIRLMRNSTSRGEDRASGAVFNITGNGHSFSIANLNICHARDLLADTDEQPAEE